MNQLKSSKKNSIEETDEFITLSSRILSYVLENKNKVMGYVAAVCVLFLVVSFTMSHMEKKAENASTALSQASEIYAGMAQNMTPENMAKAKEAFEGVVREHAGTVSGRMARVYLAGVCHRLGEYDQAIAFYQEAASEFSGNTMMENIIFSGLAHAQLKKGDRDEAVKSFEKISSGSSRLKKSEALFHKGLLSGLAGEKEKSEAAFGRIMADHAESVYYPLVKEKTAG